MAERTSGVVEALRDNGIRIEGEWYSFSKFGTAKDVRRPKKGDRVEIEYDDKAFIQKVAIAGDDASGPAAASDALRVDVDVHFAARQSALAAVVQIAPFPGVKRSLQVADAFARWLVGDLDPDSIPDRPGRREDPDASPPTSEETAPAGGTFRDLIEPSPTADSHATTADGTKLATADQRAAIKNLRAVIGHTVEDPPAACTFDAAATLIQELNQEIHDRKATAIPGSSGTTSPGSRRNSASTAPGTPSSKT